MGSYCYNKKCRMFNDDKPNNCALYWYAPAKDCEDFKHAERPEGFRPPPTTEEG